MTNKMKLLIGLLVLGIVLLGTGLVFLLFPTQQTALKVTLTPAPGTYFFNSQNDSSYVILKNVQIEKVVANRQYETAEKVPLSLIVKRGILKNQNT